MVTLTMLARILRVAADECEAIAAEQTTERLDWIDQSSSPLGPRRHCRAVKALVSASKPGAAILGRRHLLSPQAVTEALQSLSSPNAHDNTEEPEHTDQPDEQDEVAAMKRELQLVRGGSR